MSRRFYLYAPQANQPRLYGAARRRGATERGEKEEEKKERKVKKTPRVFRRVPMQFVSHFISGRERSHLSPCIPNPLPVPLPVRRVCTFARFIPVERRQPGLFRSSLPLKLAKEITAARHDFPILWEKRRGEERRGCAGVERPDCDATTSFKYHGKQGPQ